MNLLFGAQFINRGVRHELATHTSFSVIKCDRFFLMTAAAENPVSHKCHIFYPSSNGTVRNQSVSVSRFAASGAPTYCPRAGNSP
jgi:hypothetical protein